MTADISLTVEPSIPATPPGQSISQTRRNVYLFPTLEVQRVPLSEGQLYEPMPDGVAVAELAVKELDLATLDDALLEDEIEVVAALEADDPFWLSLDERIKSAFTVSALYL